MRVKISLRPIILAVVAVLVIALGYYLFLHFSQRPQYFLPVDIKYALEYFNAVNSNKTIIVPSAYYTYAKALAINGNNVVQNDSLYARLLLGNAPNTGDYYVLIAMSQLDNLSLLYNEAGLAANYSIVPFPITYTKQNLTTGARNCLVYSNSSREFSQCNLYFGGVKAGNISLAIFPSNTSALYTVNASVFYNGEQSVYIPSTISTNSTNLKLGIMFVYENITTLYLPKELMRTFYGREMFLPLAMLNNVVDGYGEARVVS